MEPDLPRSDIRLLARAASMLRLFAAGAGSRRLQAMADATGLSKATAYRLATGLCSEELLRRLEDGSYALGPLVNALGAQASGALRDRARPVLQRMTAVTGETSLMFELASAGDCAVCIEQIESPQGLRLVGTVGARLPLQAGGSSRAILAFMEPAAQDAVIAMLPARHQARLRRLIRQTRQTGYAMSFEETNEGISGVAAPLFDPRGRVIGSIALIGPVTRMQGARLMGLAAVVLDAAAEIDGRPPIPKQEAS